MSFSSFKLQVVLLEKQRNLEATETEDFNHESNNDSHDEDSNDEKFESQTSDEGDKSV